MVFILRYSAMETDYEGLSREELIEELKKSKEVLDMFSNTVMGGIAKMSVEDMSIIHASEGYYRMTGYTKEESIFPPFSNCGLNLVIPEDMDRIGAAMEILIRDNKPIQADYRIRKKDGTIAWNSAFSPCVRENGQVRYVEVFFLDTTQEKNTELQLASLLNNMSSGLVRIDVGPGILIHYANSEFYFQSGYSPEEFAACPIADDYLHIIHPDDKDRLMDTIRAYMNPKKRCEPVNFRIIRKDGQQRWIRAYISRFYEELQNETVFQCILTDITQEREREKQNLLNEEKFRIISEQTRDVIFDWDISADSVCYSSVFEKMFGFPPPPAISTKKLLESDIFHEEDKPVIVKMREDMRAALPYVECRVRMKSGDGTYFWTLHRATTIYDEDHNSYRVVGVISDINDFMKHTLDWQHKASHDLLTGLWNRSAGKEQVETVLNAHTEQQGHAFVHFDIDRFKQINDFMGHAGGDLALRQIARQMKEVFEGDDILIRMGGDEFGVFMVGAGNGRDIRLEVERLMKTIYGDFKFQEKIYPLSVSIGIAVYPQDGHTFQELYEHADSALYKAKHSGGNIYKFYS